jgi:hypothetical protein
MAIKRITATVTTDSSGDATASLQNANGLFYQVRYVVDGVSPLATGADITLIEDDTGLNVLTMANIGTSSLVRSPRLLSADSSNGTVGTNSDLIAVAGDLTLTIAQGGDTKTGVFHVYILEV